MKLIDKTPFFSSRNVPLWAGVVIVIAFAAMILWLR